jgi:5-methylcytosine-specific restriction endonuclease McrA
MHDKQYEKYLDSPKWKIKKIKYWASVGDKKCQACGSRKNLHVHHKTYIRFGNELLSDLCGLCNFCHIQVHKMARKNGGKLELATNQWILIMKRKLHEK